MELLLIGIGVGAFWYFNQGKKFLENYKVTFIDARFNYKATETALFTKIYFTVNLNVSNVTDFMGTLQSAKINIALNSGKNLGYVNLPTPVTIKAKGNTTVSIPVELPTLSIVPNVLEIIDAVKNGKAISLKLTGNLNFNIGTLTVNEIYPVKLV